MAAGGLLLRQTVFSLPVPCDRDGRITGQHEQLLLLPQKQQAKVSAKIIGEAGEGEKGDKEAGEGKALPRLAAQTTRCTLPSKETIGPVWASFSRHKTLKPL